MINFIEIIGFIVLAYTAYLIITEGNKKPDGDSNDSDASASETVKKEEDKPTSNKPENKIEKRTSTVKPAEGETDVLRQGKNYDEQQSNDYGSSYQNTGSSKYEQQVVEQNNTQDVPPPSTKNSEQHSQDGNTMVSVVCPYCDNKVLVPKGGCAECSCCSSILNDNGGIVED